MKPSKRFRINLRNILKGLIYSLLTAVLTEITQYKGMSDINFNRMGLVLLTGFISYISTKFFQDENGNYITKK